MTKAIIFDLQGTLIDNGVYPSPLRQARYFLRAREQYHDFVPKFEKIFMTKKFDTLKEALVEVTKEFGVDMPAHIMDKMIGVWNKNKLLSKIYPDTIPCLESLKGKYKLILVANCDCFTRDVIEKFNLDKYFDLIQMSCDTGFLKHDKEFYLNPLSELGISPEDAIVVGDSIDSDVMGADNAGIKVILLDRKNNREFEDKIGTLADLEANL